MKDCVNDVAEFRIRLCSTDSREDPNYTFDPNTLYWLVETNYAMYDMECLGPDGVRKLIATFPGANEYPGVVVAVADSMLDTIASHLENVLAERD